METQNIVIPIVHLNGTSRKSLIAQREEFYSKLFSAARALCEMGPNGRDYYPEPGRMEKAIAQHERRLSILRDLLAEIETEIGMLAE